MEMFRQRVSLSRLCHKLNIEVPQVITNDVLTFCTNVETDRCLTCNMELMDVYTNAPILIRACINGHGQLYHIGAPFPFVLNVRNDLPDEIRLFTMLNQYCMRGKTEASFNQIRALSVIYSVFIYDDVITWLVPKLRADESSDGGYESTRETLELAVSMQALMKRIGGRAIRMHDHELILENSNGQQRCHVIHWDDKLMLKSPETARQMFDDLLEFVGPGTSVIPESEVAEMRAEIECGYDVCLLIQLLQHNGSDTD